MGKLTEEQKAANRLKREQNPPKIHQITRDYRVVGRDVCFTLERLSHGEWKMIGHHTELKNAIISVSKHVTRDHMDDLVYVANQLEEIKQLCLKMI